jgi:hypothetical protein
MKRFFNIPLAIIILASALTVGVQAQSSSAPRLNATIPFTFTAGHKTLPAGKYTVTVVNPSSDRRILQIRSLDGRSSVLVQTMGKTGDAVDNSRLVFDRYGDTYVFAHAQMAGDSTTLAAVRSKSEQKQWVAKANKKSVVVITGE